MREESPKTEHIFINEIIMHVIFIQVTYRFAWLKISADDAIITIARVHCSCIAHLFNIGAIFLQRNSRFSYNRHFNFCKYFVYFLNSFPI